MHLRHTSVSPLHDSPSTRTILVHNEYLRLEQLVRTVHEVRYHVGQLLMATPSTSTVISHYSNSRARSWLATSVD